MRLIVIGAGGHAKVVGECAEQSGRFDEIAFLDNTYPQRTAHCHWDIIEHTDAFERLIDESTKFFVAIGQNAARATWQKRLVQAGCKVTTLVHPRANISRDVTIGAGTLVLAGATINMDTQIGEGCIVNTNASVDHDCTVEDFCHLAPGVNLAGAVNVREGVFLGVGVAAIPGSEVGAHATVGAGATIIHPIAANVTAVGTPATALSKKK